MELLSFFKDMCEITLICVCFDYGSSDSELDYESEYEPDCEPDCDSSAKLVCDFLLI